jgi:hypothetical protein
MGSGTVTSVATSGAGISGGPITGTGTLTVQWNAGSVATVGTGLSLSGGTLTATGGGTVTSVGLTVPADMTVTGSPVTGAGTWRIYSEIVSIATRRWRTRSRAIGTAAWRRGGNTLVAGRFAVNDAVHHIVCAFRQTAALSGTTLGMYLQLSDAATNQVCIVFRSDGVILLTSATPAGPCSRPIAGR